MWNGATAKYMTFYADCCSPQRNGNFGIKQVFFWTYFFWEVICLRDNLFSRLCGHWNSQEQFWLRTRNSFGSCPSIFDFFSNVFYGFEETHQARFMQESACAELVNMSVSHNFHSIPSKACLKLPQRSIKSVFKIARELPQRSMKSPFRIARELPQRSIKSLFKIAGNLPQRSIKSAFKIARRLPQGSIKSVCKFARELPQRNIKGLLKIARELPQRSIKSVLKNFQGFSTA